ncbi:MAG: YfhO family protein [Verrucomicrobiota bacterium]
MPITLFFVGFCAWVCFRRLGFSPATCLIGGLAALLNSDFFSTTCWGVGSQVFCFGLSFLAVAALSPDPPGQPQSPAWLRWMRVCLAGFAVGIGVMEAADIGAYFSILVGCFLAWQLLVALPATPAAKISRVTTQALILVVCAFFISAHSVSNLIGTQIKGVVGTKQDEQSKAAHWDWATGWSLHKKGALGLIIPGLYGYRMQPPPDDASYYWGPMGRDAAWDAYLEGPEKDPATSPPPRGPLRFAGGGNYQGIFVVLVAAWAAAQSLRRKNSPFTTPERRLIWFWGIVVIGSLLLAFGRYAPFYWFWYHLPYFNTVRVPSKFLHLLSFAMIMLFGYGIQGLVRQYLQSTQPSRSFRQWWAKAAAFDKRWILGCAGFLVLSLLGWFIYMSRRADLVAYLHYLEQFQPLGKSNASDLATFSITQVGWYVLFLGASVGLLTLAVSGQFSGKRARGGLFLFGMLLVIDLCHANLPVVAYWDYKYKYASNPILDRLKVDPYEQRVTRLPWWFLMVFNVKPDLSNAEQTFEQLESVEWAQHHFLLMNIQSLDVVQMSRLPEDLLAYETALWQANVKLPETAERLPRWWQLTNTRYILAATELVNYLNGALDPVQQRFHPVQRFNLTLKPGVQHYSRGEDITAVPSPEGAFALIEFTGALPRAKLYSNWQVPALAPGAAAEVAHYSAITNAPIRLQQYGTNDYLTLQKLSDPDFDPARTVLLAAPPADAPGAPAVSNGTNGGTVQFASYAPKDIRFQTESGEPSILLLNDRYDPNWKVTVDGKPAELLRANFIMRGVYVPAGKHTVEFTYRIAGRTLFLSLAGLGLALVFTGVVTFYRPRPAPMPAKAE